MASSRLTDIQKFLEKKEESISGPYVCYVTNMDSPHPWPRRYTYRGCLYPRFKDFTCGKSIELREPCKHHGFDPLEIGNHALFYRLVALLTDANHGGLPLKCTMFQAAKSLLDLDAVEFQRMSEDGQKTFLQQISWTTPLVSVWIRTKADGSVILQKLDKVISIEDSPPSSPPDLFLTPATSRFSTPKFGRQGEGSSSSSACKGDREGSSSSSACKGDRSARGKVRLDKTEDSSIKRSLAEVMDFLGSLSTRDGE